MVHQQRLCVENIFVTLGELAEGLIQHEDLDFEQGRFDLAPNDYNVEISAKSLYCSRRPYINHLSKLSSIVDSKVTACVRLGHDGDHKGPHRFKGRARAARGCSIF